MKVTRLVLGVFSFILFIIISLQSCTVGARNIVMDGLHDLGGAAGLWLAVFLLTAGIVGIATKDNKAGGITAGVLYVVGALPGFFYHGIYGDLIIWAIVSTAFGMTCIIGTIIADNLKRIDADFVEWKAKNEDRERSERN